MIMKKEQTVGLIILIAGVLFFLWLGGSFSFNSKAAPSPSSASDDVYQTLSVDYIRKGNAIYRIMPVMDPASYRVIAGDLGVDAVATYWQGEPLDVHPKTVRAISDSYGTVVAVLDDASVYAILGTPIKIVGADPATFKIIQGSRYAKDANHVYYLQYGYVGDSKVTTIEGADPASFKLLGACVMVEKDVAYYAEDVHRVYVESQALVGADPASFVILGTSVANGGEIESTFTFAKDDRQVYYNCGQILKGADYATFTFDNGKAEDKNNIYSLGEFGFTATKKVHP